jgi:hypothetical protein
MALKNVVGRGYVLLFIGTNEDGKRNTVFLFHLQALGSPPPPHLMLYKLHARLARGPQSLGVLHISYLPVP